MPFARGIICLVNHYTSISAYVTLTSISWVCKQVWKGIRNMGWWEDDRIRQYRYKTGEKVMYLFYEAKATLKSFCFSAYLVWV